MPFWVNPRVFLRPERALNAHLHPVRARCPDHGRPTACATMRGCAMNFAVLSALAEPTRLEAISFNSATQSQMSRHRLVLRQADLVAARKEPVKPAFALGAPFSATARAFELCQVAPLSKPLEPAQPSGQRRCALAAKYSKNTAISAPCSHTAARIAACADWPCADPPCPAIGKRAPENVSSPRRARAGAL